jgi:hypothetical protein
LIGQKQGKQRWLRSEGRDKYKIVGVKLQDYLDFKKVADLMRTKDHLTTLLLPFALKKARAEAIITTFACPCPLGCGPKGVNFCP